MGGQTINKKERGREEMGGQTRNKKERGRDEMRKENDQSQFNCFV